MGYHNRQRAGKQLARELGQYNFKNVVVLALPRGGVVVGSEVAKALNAPLGAVLVRKIGYPLNEEYAIGAIAEDELPVYSEDDVSLIENIWLKQAVISAQKIIDKRRRLYYSEGFKPPKISGKTIILVDDGIATGLTMLAAVKAVKTKHPNKIVIAVPVSSQEGIDLVKNEVDEVIVLDDPKNFLGAVGTNYQEFNQVSDEEVKKLLREASYDTQNSPAAHR